MHPVDWWDSGRAEKEGKRWKGEKKKSWKVEKEPRDGCRPPQWGVTGSQKHHCHRSHDPACIEVQDEVGKRWHIGGETPAWRSIFISILIV